MVESAIKGGFVDSMSDFFYRTVRDFFSKNMSTHYASNVDQMISLINSKITQRNRENQNGNQIRQINKH